MYYWVNHVQFTILRNVAKITIYLCRVSPSKQSTRPWSDILGCQRPSSLYICHLPWLFTYKNKMLDLTMNIKLFVKSLTESCGEYRNICTFWAVSHLCYNFELWLCIYIGSSVNVVLACNEGKQALIFAKRYSLLLTSSFSQILYQTILYLHTYVLFCVFAHDIQCHAFTSSFAELKYCAHSYSVN